jgi:SAM-dependent methyltransferase
MYDSCGRVALHPLIERLLHWLRFNLRYFHAVPWDTGITPPEVEAFIQAHPPGKMLDLGCGTGTNLVRFAQAGWQVTGVDFAIKAVNEARKKLRQNHLDGIVLQSEVTNIRKLMAPFDLVLDIGCYHGLSANQRALYRQNLGHLVAVGGTFLVYAHLKIDTMSQMGILEDELDHFTPDCLLISRQISRDRWDRKACWLEYLRPITNR